MKLLCREDHNGGAPQSDVGDRRTKLGSEPLRTVGSPIPRQADLTRPNGGPIAAPLIWRTFELGCYQLLTVVSYPDYLLTYAKHLADSDTPNLPELTENLNFGLAVVLAHRVRGCRASYMDAPFCQAFFSIPVLQVEIAAIHSASVCGLSPRALMEFAG